MTTVAVASLPQNAIPGIPGILATLFSKTGDDAETARDRFAGSKRERDALLVERARRGDQDSFRILIELHARAVYTLALRIVLSPQDAEEVAQDAFVRAWRALPEFRGESSFATWLYRIASRRALVRAVSLRRRAQSETPLDAHDVEGRPDPASIPATNRTRLRLERLVAALPEMQRAAVTLFYLQNRSVQEVATTLDLPPGTVKTHLYRSRAALREAWLRETSREENDELRRL